MIHSKLIKIRVTEYEHEVAHLFEHLFLRHLSQQLSAHDSQWYVSTMLSGETYSDFIFIKFQTPRISTLEIFMKFIREHDQNLLSDIETELLAIQIEERSILGACDTKQLRKQLIALNTLEWTEISSEDATAQYFMHQHNFDNNTIIKLHKDAHKFTDVTLAVGIRGATPDELLLFDRLANYILWGLNEHFSVQGYYVRAMSRAVMSSISKIDGTRDAGTLSIFGRLRGQGGVRYFESHGQKWLEKFRDNGDYSVIKDDIALQGELYSMFDRPSHVFDRLVVLASNDYVEKLATNENLQSVCGKIFIKASATHSRHYDLIK